MKSTQKPFGKIHTLATTIFFGCLLGIATSASAQTLLLQYDFNEPNSSDDALDHGATPAANGVLVNAGRTNDTPGNFSEGALESTGASSGNLRYVIASDSNGEVDKLDGLASFTLTTWINVQETPVGNRRLIAKQAAGTFDGFSWNIADSVAGGTRGADNFGLRLFVGGDAGFGFDNSAVTINASNQWVFVAVTYDGTIFENNVKYYVGDTSNAATNQAITTIVGGTTTPSTAAFGLGYTDAAPTANTAFPGLMDDARVYSGVLTDEQIEAVRLENLPGVNPPAAVTITNPNRSGTTVTFDFVSQSGSSYVVEYKNSLSDPTWQTLTNITGTGSTETVTDETADSETRFYHVVTQ